MSCPPIWAERIRAGLAGELAPADWKALRAHLAGCVPCRAVYDRAGAGVALLEGRAGLPPEAARTAGRAGLFAALDEQESAPENAEQAPDPLAPSPPSGRRRWAVGGLVAAAAGLAFFLLQPPQTGEKSLFPSLDARGAEGSAHSFKLFCLDVEGAQPRIRAVGAQHGPPARCAQTDRLQFTWSSREAGLQNLQIFALGPEGPLQYWPPAGVEPLHGPAVDAPLAGSFSPPGRGSFRIVAWVGPALSEAEVSAWWALSGGGLDLLPAGLLEAKLEVQ